MSLSHVTPDNRDARRSPAGPPPLMVERSRFSAAASEDDDEERTSDRPSPSIHLSIEGKPSLDCLDEDRASRTSLPKARAHSDLHPLDMERMSAILRAHGGMQRLSPAAGGSRVSSRASSVTSAASGQRNSGGHHSPGGGVMAQRWTHREERPSPSGMAAGTPTDEKDKRNSLPLLPPAGRQRPSSYTSGSGQGAPDPGHLGRQGKLPSMRRVSLLHGAMRYPKEMLLAHVAEVDDDGHDEDWGLPAYLASRPKEEEVRRHSQYNLGPRLRDARCVCLAIGWLILTSWV